MADDPKDDVLAQGLKRFYSSQAEVMLAQYRNINDLLGPTTHHTHPGTHCELLLRNCIRQILPPSWSADKGFIYGRLERDGKEQHSPEIDILIHDTSVRRPIFRLDDFVVVHPKAVVGLIQVKKSLEGEQLNSGVQNVVTGKQHLFDMLRKGNDGHFLFQMLPYSAVVAFEESFSESTLKRILSKCSERHRSYEMPKDKPWRTSCLVLPDFVGTLQGQVAIGDGGMSRRSYYVYDSRHGVINMALQFLLWTFSASRPDKFQGTSVFTFDPDMARRSAFAVGEEPVNLASGDCN